MISRVHARVVVASVLATFGCANRDATRREPETLVAALHADPGHLNPAITTNGGVHTAASLLFNGLLTLNEDFSTTPDLARSWQVFDGGSRYRFRLRSDVRWHDGQPFTAADVKFTFDSLLLRFHARTRASLAPVLRSIDVLDDSTVEFRLHRPYAPLLQQLDVVEAPILPRHVYGTGDPLRQPANRHPVGTGPYRFVSYRSDHEIRYAANAAYHGRQPDIRNVVFRIMPDAGMQVAALEAGEVDWIFSVPGPELRRLRRNRFVRMRQSTIGAGGSNCITTFGFNLDRPMFRDRRVRRAIAHAVDRRQYLERVAFGEGRVADAPISSRIAFAHASGLEFPAFDTAAATRLLTEAGWRREADAVRRARDVPGVTDGTPLVIGFKGLPAQSVYGELLRAQLRPLGVEVRVEALEQGVFSAAVFTRRDFDMAIASYCNGTDPEIGVRRQYVSSSIAPVPFSNMAAYRNAAVDSLFDAAIASLDPDVRRALYHRIQEIVIRDQPYIWLLESAATHAHTVRCRDFGPVPHFAATASCRG